LEERRVAVSLIGRRRLRDSESKLLKIQKNFTTLVNRLAVGAATGETAVKG
jgi:hypothetical protein